MYLRFISIFIVIAVLAACTYKKESDLINVCNTSNVKYSDQIAGIMQTSCNACHSGASPSAGILTDNYNSVKTIALNGSLYGSMSHASNYSPMPKGVSKLDSCTLAKVKVWVDAGAPNN